MRWLYPGHIGSDGSYPYYAVLIDVNGAFYGTTNSGGSYDGGGVFAIAP